MIKEPIQNITVRNFERYGKILAFSEGYSGNFEIIVKETSAPWRLAVLRVKNRASSFLENHPDSMESFEPVRGTALLIVAENACPDSYEVFLLDQPVCLHKGIWHDVVALSEEALVKVAENLEVTCAFHNFEREIQPVMFQESI